MVHARPGCGTPFKRLDENMHNNNSNTARGNPNRNAVVVVVVVPKW
jgi:hypothetical protein